MAKSNKPTKPSRTPAALKLKAQRRQERLAARERRDDARAEHNVATMYAARWALVPVFGIALTVVVSLVLALWSGEVKELGRNTRVVLRATNEAAYWKSVAFLAFFSLLLPWLTVKCVQHSRWFGAEDKRRKGR
jgi:hypothetical protein